MIALAQSVTVQAWIVEHLRRMRPGFNDWMMWLFGPVAHARAVPIGDYGFLSDGEVSALLRDSGLVDVEVARDLAGRDRIVTGRRPG